MKDSPTLLLDHLAGRYEARPFPFASPFTHFHEMMTAEFSPLIELDPSNGWQPFTRDKIGTPTGSAGTQESGDGELELFTGTTAGSEQLVSTHERGRYQPGIVGVPGQAFRTEGVPTDDAEIWTEYGDGIDAIRTGRDGTGRFVQYIHGSTVEPRVYQGDWNVDNLDGTGGDSNPSGAVLDFEDMNVVRNPFLDYGGGPGAVTISLEGPEGGQIYVTAHVFTGAKKRKFFANPKLPLRQYVNNGSTNTNLRLFIGGRQFAVLGRYAPNRKETSVESDGDVSIVTTEYRPVISMRKKDLRKWLARSVKVSGVGLPADTDGFFRIVVGGTLDISGAALTDSDWGDIDGIPPQETAMEFNTTANGITGGYKADSGPLVGGGGNRYQLAGIRRLGLDIPDNVVVTLCAKAKTTDGTVFGTFSLEEEA